MLDLRGNPGGLLNEGVAVADQFLQKGQTIVSHRGRASPEKVLLRHDTATTAATIPIVVLVNQHSASAAEIVSGALQDHDRAWILGETTFGKGLVQTVYPLSENTGLALTTAHYYTPSGRLIQRDYSNISFFDYYYRNDTDTRNPQDVKMTDSGRTVYGGGGITPDEKYVPQAGRTCRRNSCRKYAFFNFTKYYFGTHTNKLPEGWAPDATIADRVPRLAPEAGFDFTEADFTKDHDWIKTLARSRKCTSRLSAWTRAAASTIETDPEGGEGHRGHAQGQGAAGYMRRKIMVQRMMQH